eukprot:s932_g14.t1
MERVASTRVELWRSQRGLQDEQDFAFAFSSYGSAVAHGGHHVATAWLSARSKALDEEDLASQGAAVIESSSSCSIPSLERPAPAPSMLQQELTAKVQLTEELTQRAAARRAEAQQLAALSKMPPALHGKALSSYMRNGSALCGAFQSHTCQFSEADCPGLHRCAVLRKSGRVCGLGHAAADCWDKKFCPVEALPAGETSPATQAKPPREEDEALPIPEVLALQGPDQKFDRLATIRGKLAEVPSLIYANSMGGKVWLSGLPTRGTVHEVPSSRGGLVLPNALLMHLRIANARLRTADFEEVWPVLRNTVFAGEAALVHCLSGRHRAGVGGCLFRALLAQEPWDLAVEQAAILTHPVRDPFPLPCGYLAGSEAGGYGLEPPLLLQLFGAYSGELAPTLSLFSGAAFYWIQARIILVLTATSLTVPDDQLPIAKKLRSASGFGGTVRAINGDKDHGCMAFASFPFRRPMELQAWLGLQPLSVPVLRWSVAALTEAKVLHASVYYELKTYGSSGQTDDAWLADVCHSHRRFTALMILLVTPPAGLCLGLPAVGYAPPCCVFPEQVATRFTRDDDWRSHNARILSRLKSGPGDQSLLEQSIKDAEKGFCSHPLTKKDLLATIREEPYRLLPRWVTTPASWKQRPLLGSSRNAPAMPTSTLTPGSTILGNPVVQLGQMPIVFVP